MKTNAMRTLSKAIFLAVLLFIGCKKAETGPTGATGPQGPSGVVTSMSDGHITGTLTGTRRDGTTFSEPFSYTYYFGGQSGELDSLSATSYNFSLARSNNDILGAHYASLNIATTSKSASTGTLDAYFNYERLIATNKMFYFSGSASGGTVTSFSYNATTGLCTGNFNITIPGIQNNTTNNATVMGSFQATMTQMVYKQSLGSEIIKD